MMDLTKLYTATFTLVVVMDPLGNIPVFLSLLKDYPPSRQRVIMLRESVIAFFVLLFFLFFGSYLLRVLQISIPAISVAGGIILFLIAIKMIFPQKENNPTTKMEPLLVPIAIPLTPGPSAIATVMLFASREPQLMTPWVWTVVIASLLFMIVMLSSQLLMKVLGSRGLIALERLMGMLLTTIAVEMFLSGFKHYFS